MTPLARARQYNRKIDRLIPRFRRDVKAEKNRYINEQVQHWARSHSFSDRIDAAHEAAMLEIFTANYRRIFRVAKDYAVQTTEKLMAVKKEPLFDVYFGDWLITNGGDKARSTAQTTAQDLKRLMRAAFEAEEAEAVVIKAGLRAKGLSAFRADTIARTEVAMAAAYATKRTIEGIADDVQVKNLTKQWVPVNDDRTRDAHADMAGSPPIGRNEMFNVGGELMDGPHDPNASAANVINCRCVAIYDFDL